MVVHGLTGTLNHMKGRGLFVLRAYIQNAGSDSKGKNHVPGVRRDGKAHKKSGTQVPSVPPPYGVCGSQGRRDIQG
jgi:hypothetical protein